MLQRRADYLSGLWALLVCVPLLWVFAATLGDFDSVLTAYPTSMWTGAALKTIGLIIGSSIVAVLLGTTSACMLHHYKWPLQSLWKFAAVLPLAFPSHLYALAALTYLDPQGLLQTTLRTWGLKVYVDPKGMLLLCLVVGLSLSPYCFLFLLGSLRRQDPKLFESARLLRSKAGVGNKLSIMQVRLLLPAIIASIWFIALDSFGDLGASVVLGQDTLMALIYDTWIGLHSFNAALALSLSSLLLFGLLFFLSPGKKVPQTAVRLPQKTKPNKTLQIFGTAYFAGLFAIGTALPVLLFLTQSLKAPSGWTEVIKQSIYSSGLAALVATVCVLTGLAMVFTQQRLRTPSWLVELGYIGYAVPGLIFGVCVYVVAVSALKLIGMQMSPAVSFTVLVAALTAKFYAVASKNARSVLSCEKKCVFESAQLLSPNLWQSFHQVFWKGSRPAWFAGALLVILEVMKEVPITLVLRPFGFHSLSTLVFELSTEGLYEQASLPALFLVCLGMLFLYLLDPERRDLQYEH